MGTNTAAVAGKKTFGQWLKSRKGQQTVIIICILQQLTGAKKKKQ